MSLPWYTEKMIKNYIREFQGNFNNTQDFIDEINSLLNENVIGISFVYYMKPFRK